MPEDSTEGIISGSTRIGSLSETLVVDMISEGEVEGLVEKEYNLLGTVGDIGFTGASISQTKNPLQSVFWNNVPVVDDQNLFNYQDVDVKQNFGTKNGSFTAMLRKDQDFFKFLETTKAINERLRGPTDNASEFPDDAEFFKKTYRVLNTQCFAIKFNIKISILDTLNKDDGVLKDNEVKVNVQTRALFNNQMGVFNNTNEQGVDPEISSSEPLGGKFNGRVSSPFIKQYFIDFSKRSDFSALMENPNFLGWEIKVFRTTKESTTSDSRATTFVDSITELYKPKLSYPNSAAISSIFSAEYFASIPQRSFDMNLMRVKIPSNYDPLTRQYHGTWDGTFSTESTGPFTIGTQGSVTQADGSDRQLQKYFTNNPAWCYYDLITNPRYGLGKYIEEDALDKWSLYEIAQYCDVLVYDGMGKGGLEPRFTCNTLIQSREDAFKVIQDMASVFRGLSYYAAGQIYAIQDSEKTPIYQFTDANVKNGEFTYSNTSRRIRNNVAIVRYNDKDNFYKPAVEYTEDVDGIRKNGIRETEVTAFGCTSRGQAMRLGKWMLATENFETETISFTAGLEGNYIRPGDVIEISDTNRKNLTRNGGRTKNIDLSESNASGQFAQVTLDAPIDVYREGDANDAGNKPQMYNFSLLIPKANLDPYNVTDITSSDTFEIRSSQVQTLSFLGNQVDNYERYYESDFANSFSEWSSSNASTAVASDFGVDNSLKVTASTTNGYHRIIFENVPNIVVGRKYRFKARVLIPGTAPDYSDAPSTLRGIQFRYGNGISNAGPIIHPTLGEWTDIEYEWVATDQNGASYINQVSLWMANSSTIDTTATFQWAGDGGGSDRYYIYNIVIEPAIEKNQSRITFSGGYTFDVGDSTVVQDQSVWAISPTGDALLLNSQGITIDSDDIAEKYRVINIKESEKNEYSITALEYNEEKYSKIEDNFQSNAAGVNVSTTLPFAPSSLTLSERRAPGSQHTQLIKYTISPPNDQLALAGYEVFMKKTTQWVIADYTGRYPSLFKENNGNVTFMEQNPLNNDKNFIPDNKYKIAIHQRANTTIENEIVADESTQYFFKAVSFNGLGMHSAETVRNSIVIDDSEAIKDIVISNLRLENDTVTVNDSAQFQTADGGITDFTGANPRVLWDTSIQGAGALATQFNYAISLRQGTDASRSQPTPPMTTQLFEITTGFQPTLTQNGSFVYSIPASDLANIESKLQDHGRNFDVVVEAHTKDGKTSAGGQLLVTSDGEPITSNLEYTTVKGYDVAVLKNPKINNPRFSANQDDCGANDKLCTIQSMTADNRLKIEFTKNTFKTNEKDVAGGFFYMSPTSFAKSEIQGKTQSFFDDKDLNPKNIQRVRMDNYTDMMYVPFKGDLETTSVFCAYSLFDTFDREIESQYLDQTPNNTNYNPDYDLGSRLPISTVAEVEYRNPLAGKTILPEMVFLSQFATDRRFQHRNHSGYKPLREFNLLKPIGKTKLLYFELDCTAFSQSGSSRGNTYSSVGDNVRIYVNNNLVASSEQSSESSFNATSTELDKLSSIQKFTDDLGHRVFTTFHKLGFDDTEFDEGATSVATVRIEGSSPNWYFSNRGPTVAVKFVGVCRALWG